MGLSLLAVGLAFAASDSTDFASQSDAWLGGGVQNGVLLLDGESAVLELGAVGAVSVSLRVRQLDAGRMGLAFGGQSWSADYGAQEGGITLGERAIPLAPEHRVWVPDSQPIIVPDETGWMGADALHCEIIEVDGTFYLFWTGAMAPGYGYRQIGLATSSDAVNWVPYAGNPVLTIDYDKTTIDGIHVHMPTVVVDPDSGGWAMFYSCYQDGVGNRICRATSGDGLSWIPRGVALDFGAEGDFDSGSLRMPDVLIDDSGTWQMLYNGTMPDEHYGPTGYATSSDGVNWTKQGAITANGDRLQGGGMLETAYGVEQWWNCADAFCASVADPSDWSTWKDLADPILVKNWAAWNSGYIQSPSALQIGEQLHMWFNAYDYTVGHEVITHAESQPQVGVWMDLELSWDGATLTVQQDQGPTLSVDAPVDGVLSLSSTGRLEVDEASWTWTPVVEEPVDTAEAGLDTAQVDTAPKDSKTDFPRMPDGGDGLPPDGCGCGAGSSGGAGSVVLLLGALLLFRRRAGAIGN
ncbi:MAG: hypothetical protein ACI9VR_001714 [Cognaticolwellia sp.]|jgi:hypothetical protein